MKNAIAGLNVIDISEVAAGHAQQVLVCQHGSLWLTCRATGIEQPSNIVVGGFFHWYGFAVNSLLVLASR